MVWNRSSDRESEEDKTLAAHCGVKEPTSEKERDAWNALEKEWLRQRRQANRLLWWWRISTAVPATAAAVATILATTHAAKWVLATPSAIATATAAALGGFGFRGNFAKHKDLAEALALEAVAFAVKADGYAGDMQSRVDRLVANQRAIVKGEPVSRKPVSKPA